MPTPKFQKGNKFGKGGSRPGSGQPADWLREKCKKIVEKDQLVEFLRDVAAGKDFYQCIHEDTGEVLPFPAKIRDRKDAAIYLIERGYGKTPLPVEVTDESSGKLGSTPARDVLALAGLLARECSKGA